MSDALFTDAECPAWNHSEDEGFDQYVVCLRCGPEFSFGDVAYCLEQRASDIEALTARVAELDAAPSDEAVREALATLDRALCEGGSEGTDDENCDGYQREDCDGCPMGIAVRSRALVTVTAALGAAEDAPRMCTACGETTFSIEVAKLLEVEVRASHEAAKGRESVLRRERDHLRDAVRELLAADAARHNRPGIATIDRVFAAKQRVDELLARAEKEAGE